MGIILFIGAVLVIFGIIGSVFPGIPGPVLSYAGIVILFLVKGPEIASIWHLTAFGILLIFLLLADYLAPILGARLAGSGKKGIYGAIIGALIGIFFIPPLGIFLGALIGAVIGEYYSGKRLVESLKAGLGIILTSVVIMAAQIIYALAAAIYYFWKLPH
ncbi:MAG: hypothetical protein A2Z39_02425 [Deltaproteobacteria bacterium RBG_19FT_COMBO_46_9]|nr:MAG: hypothetical protein A2Z39_02425 [Deltaproteobacteria bacterium RBG_19FT_COMBO_46_9]